MFAQSGSTSSGRGAREVKHPSCLQSFVMRNTVFFHRKYGLHPIYFCAFRGTPAHHRIGALKDPGANPLLYPRFPDLYHAASKRGLSTAILGNPAPRVKIEELLAIQPLSIFQVSLEGLAEHNDMICGPGHFERVTAFLKVLRELDIFSMVMLTLTKNNIDQVLPLGEALSGLIDSFNFNRLSMVGEAPTFSSRQAVNTKASWRDTLKPQKTIRFWA